MHERQKWKLIYSGSRPNYNKNNDNNINDNNDNDNYCLVQKKKQRNYRGKRLKIKLVTFSCIFFIKRYVTDFKDNFI